MTKYFVVKYSKKHGKIIDSIPDETMDLLKSYNWPGNVRELENTIERAIILSKDTNLTVDNIPNMKQNNIVVNLSSKSLEEAERFHITQVLKETNWVIYGKFGAATLLNINPNTLRSRMRKLGIRKP